ncbi:MAG: hypothetical protein DWQ07_23000 [Chloroflexi bacterium]|nr:MAG: hypothetical protein DWQ07_23000 [Chloroflexota bacterium]MBL1194017.1 hypothetical protein [Chloroflexota bacterium]NOH11311.1 hypothetical protein [Chloroflexota bacterium]
MTEDKDIVQEVDEELDALDQEMDSGDSAWDWGGSNSWIWGLALIAVGGLLLLGNFTDFNFIDVSNWWAIFILVPGISMLANAFSASRRGRSGGGQAIWGGFLVLLALSFFLNISFALIWPVFLILAGAGLLFRAF